MKYIYIVLISCCLGFLSCNDDSSELYPVKHNLKSFSFLTKDNLLALVSDIECQIIGDSIIECHIPYILEDKKLVPSFELTNGKLFCDGEEIVSGVSVLDCSKSVRLEVEGNELSAFYTLRVIGYTGLPIVYINTEDKTPITSKEEYLNGTIKIVEDLSTRDVFETTMRIKGRGNSTWGMPKKPYKIKFEKKVSLLGEPADKEWILLANYSDKTLLRNKTAFDFGKISNLDYTNRTHFVEVFINGVYNGTYQLAEQLKISKNRVNVGDDGYLLEIDAKADAEDITFRVNHIWRPINIKDPDVEVGGEAYNYVVKYIQEVDSILFSKDFKNENCGYAKYIDVSSFVDWYLINEIAKNNDACFYSSCYMNLCRNGKLKMGPLWDFDIAFGNVNYNGCDNPEGFWIKDVPWYKRLFEDSNFTEKVKDRFAYFYNNRHRIFEGINANAIYLRYSAIENNNKWGTLYNYTWPNPSVWGSYENEVQGFKTWMEKRFQWLNKEFNAM